MISQLGVIVVLSILALVAIYFYSRQDACLRASCARDLARSSGTLDKKAVAALEANLKLSAPRPRDLVTRGRIFQHWVSENDPAHPARPLAARAYAEAATRIGAQQHIDLADAIMLEEIMFAEPMVGRPGTAELGEVAARARNTHLASAVEAADARTKLEAARAALGSARVFKDDPQNVHDSSVVGDLRRTYEALKIPEGPARKQAITAQLDSLLSYARKTGASDVEPLVSAAARNDHPLSAYSDTEAAILASVWCRSKANEKYKKEARDAVITSLRDCRVGGVGVGANDTVCTGGRAARYLSALAGVDDDPEIGRAGSFDAYKNQIYAEAANIVRNYSAEDTPAAKEYAGLDGEPTPAEKADFASRLGLALHDLTHSYSDRLSPEQIKKLEADCLVYAML